MVTWYTNLTMINSHSPKALDLFAGAGSGVTQLKGCIDCRAIAVENQVDFVVLFEVGLVILSLNPPRHLMSFLINGSLP